MNNNYQRQFRKKKLRTILAFDIYHLHCCVKGIEGESIAKLWWHFWNAWYKITISEIAVFYVPLNSLLYLPLLENIYYSLKFYNWFKQHNHLSSCHPTLKPKRIWNVRNILPMYNVEMGNAYQNFLRTKIQLIRNKKLFDFLILGVSVYK